MAEVFQQLKFDDRDIEKSIISMMAGMSKVQAKAKEVSKDIEADFKHAQSAITSQQKDTSKAQIKALGDLEKAFEKIGEKVKLGIVDIEDPTAKIEATKKITLEELDKLAVELKAKTKEIGEDPLEIDVKINALKEGVVDEFDQQLKELQSVQDNHNKESEAKQEASGKRIISGLIKTGKSAVTVLLAAASVVGAAILAAGVAMFKLGSNSDAVDKQSQKLKKSWAELKRTLGETFAPFAYAVQKVFLAGMESIKKKIAENKQSLTDFSIDLAAKIYAAGKTIIAFFENQGLANERALARLKKYGATMEFIFSPRVFTKSGWQEYHSEIDGLNKIIDENKAKMTGLGETYKKTYSEAKSEIGKLVEEGFFRETKATNEQIAALQKLREEYKKLLEDFAKKSDQTALDAIVDPFKKLEAIKAKGLIEVGEFEKAIIQTAKLTGEDLPAGFEETLARMVEAVEQEYLKGLIELNKEMRKIEIQALPTDRDHLGDLLAKQFKNVFNISDSLIKEAAGKGINIEKIADYLFVGPEGKAELEKQFNRDQQDFLVFLQKHVAGQKKNADKLLGVRDKEDEKEGKKGFLAKLLGISDREAAEVTQQFNKAYHAINDAIAAGTQAQIDDNDRLIESIQGRLGAAQDALRKEEELQRSGSANNVASKKRELEAIKREEAAAIAHGAELKKKALRQQLIADSLQQASSLFTAGAEIFKANAGIPIVGLITAAASIATMVALFAKFKTQAKSLTAAEIRAEMGGPLQDYGFVNRKGRTDKRGGQGHRIEDSNIIVGGKEFITNEETAAKHGSFLEKMNQGKYDHINLEETLQDKINRQKAIVEFVKSDAYKQAMVIRMRNENNADDTVTKSHSTTKIVKLDTWTELVRKHFENEVQENKVDQSFSRKHQYFIDSLRKDLENRYDLKQDHKELKRLEKKDLERKSSEFITKKEMKKMFDDHAKSVRKAIVQDRPEYLPISVNGTTTGYIKKTPNLHESIKFEEAANKWAWGIYKIAK